MSATLNLKKIQIGKFDNPESNIVISTPTEENGITTIYSGNLDELIQELIIFHATDGIQLFKPSVLESIAAGVIGKELVSAEWVLNKLTTINTQIANVITQASLLLPVGSVVYYPIASPPTNYMKCNGAAISRTTYSALFGVTNTIYGAGNGTTTFNLPELRGEFIRGFDDGRGVDTGRSIGSAQGDAIRNIVGNLFQSGQITLTSANGVFAVTANAGGFYDSGGGSGAGTFNFDASRVVPTAAENRPRNVALMPMIKYQ